MLHLNSLAAVQGTPPRFGPCFHAGDYFPKLRTVDGTLADQDTFISDMSKGLEAQHPWMFIARTVVLLSASPQR